MAVSKISAEEDELRTGFSTVGKFDAQYHLYCLILRLKYWPLH